jgi:hypothetical protein
MPGNNHEKIFANIRCRYLQEMKDEKNLVTVAGSCQGSIQAKSWSSWKNGAIVQSLLSWRIENIFDRKTLS